MIIAIDYDKTYTEDPKTFDLIITVLKHAGHTVICVTGRSDHESMSAEVKSSIGQLVPVVFAGKLWKREAAEQAGYKVDIWIDDMPGMIERQLLIGQ